MNPGLLDMCRVCSDDAVLGAVGRMPEEDAEKWLRRHLSQGVRQLLQEPWVLDIDTTVKPVYGHQDQTSLHLHSVVPREPFPPFRPGGEEDAEDVCRDRQSVSLVAQPNEDPPCEYPNSPPLGVTRRPFRAS